MKRRGTVAASALLVLAAIASSQPGVAQMSAKPESSGQPTQGRSYVGMWITADGHVRHHLLPNGRYVEARGNRERAYEGRYEITGDHIEYWDDTGFTADGDFVEGVLHHGGMVLYRDGKVPP